MAITITKHSRPVVVCDVDGIVADFGFSLTVALKKLFGKPMYPISSLQSQGWGVEWLGLTQTHEDKFWEYLRNDALNFWENEREIIPGITKKLYEVSRSCNWYFCTTRDDTNSGTAKKQTEHFLEKHGFPFPTVTVSDRKGEFCYAVRANYFLDDNFKNCKNVREKSPDTKVFFLLLPSQAEYQAEAVLLGMNVVFDVEEFIAVLFKNNKPIYGGYVGDYIETL
jgi:hypothetical protein